MNLSSLNPFIVFELIIHLVKLFKTCSPSSFDPVRRPEISQCRELLKGRAFSKVFELYRKAQADLHHSQSHFTELSNNMNHLLQDNFRTLTRTIQDILATNYGELL